MGSVGLDTLSQPLNIGVWQTLWVMGGPRI